MRKPLRSECGAMPVGWAANVSAAGRMCNHLQHRLGRRAASIKTRTASRLHAWARGLPVTASKPASSDLGKLHQKSSNNRCIFQIGRFGGCSRHATPQSECAVPCERLAQHFDVELRLLPNHNDKILRPASTRAPKTRRMERHRLRDPDSPATRDDPRTRRTLARSMQITSTSQCRAPPRMNVGRGRVPASQPHTKPAVSRATPNLRGARQEPELNEISGAQEPSSNVRLHIPPARRLESARQAWARTLTRCASSFTGALDPEIGVPQTSCVALSQARLRLAFPSRCPSSGPSLWPLASSWSKMWPRSPEVWQCSASIARRVGCPD